MDILNFSFDSAPVSQCTEPVLCGVVGSGNLEVLMQANPHSDRCVVEVRTSARGFGDTWQVVVANFAHANPAGGVSIAIHDMGATPAVVSLRLAQALAQYQKVA